MLAALTDPETWTALFKFAVINVVLSGDNALVIALACRSLPARQQKQAFIVGTAGIVVLMTLLTSCAALLMAMPYIQIVGSVLLVWIGIKALRSHGLATAHARPSQPLSTVFRQSVIGNMLNQQNFFAT